MTCRSNAVVVIMRSKISGGTDFQLNPTSVPTVVVAIIDASLFSRTGLLLLLKIQKSLIPEA